MTARRVPRLSLLSDTDCERIHEATLGLMLQGGIFTSGMESMSTSSKPPHC